MIESLKPRALLAEFVGTTLLVFVAMMTTSMAQVGFGDVAAGNLLIPAFGHACILAGLVYAIGHVSGCHINPAVTLGLAAIGKFSPRQAPSYLVAQIAGGLLGALLHGWTWPMGPGTAMTLPAVDVSAGQAFLLEAVMTFVLVSVVIAVAVSGRVPAAAAGAAIGATLGALILVGGAITGASMNPARSLGPAIVNWHFDSHWIYWLGPIIGGLAAGIVGVLTHDLRRSADDD
ncbi:MAG: aquaporin [Chloroflexi bacterium]|nr:aquaporin [Chloroflexota bacterium]